MEPSFYKNQMPEYKQAPIGSGFNRHSTAEQVMEGVDLTDRIALVTGGSSGIGLETVKALARAGAQVVVPVRKNLKAASDALAEYDDNVRILEMDLSDIDSIMTFARIFRRDYRKLDLLINNAGVYKGEAPYLPNGFEVHLGVNFIGHYVLTRLLWPTLITADAARVIEVSSAGHRDSPIRWDDFDFRQGHYNVQQAYAQSKTANALHAVWINEFLSQTGGMAFSVHPGVIDTRLTRYMTADEQVALKIRNDDGSLTDSILEILKTPSQGAATTLWAATSAELRQDRGGAYCEDCDIAKIAADDSLPFEHVAHFAVSRHRAQMLDEKMKRILKERHIHFD